MEKPPEFDDRYNPEEEMERNRLFHLDIDDTREKLDTVAEDAKTVFNDKLLKLSIETNELNGEMVSNFTKIESLFNQRARFEKKLEETTDESEKESLIQRISNINNIIPKIRKENVELEEKISKIKPEHDAKVKIFDSDFSQN